MPHRIRVADRFKKQSAEQLVTMAGAIITGHPNKLKQSFRKAKDPVSCRRQRVLQHRVDYGHESSRIAFVCFGTETTAPAMAR